MRSLYFYGASDDLCEVDCPDHQAWTEETTYYDPTPRQGPAGFALETVLMAEGVTAHYRVEFGYAYDGDWGVWLSPATPLPAGWRLHPIRGNVAKPAREWAGPAGVYGTVLHLEVPDDTVIRVRPLRPDPEE